MSILDLTALELGKKIKAGEITSPQATEAVIKQIKAVEEQVHSYVTLDEEGAMKRAKEVQAQIEAGTLTGPLAGVPAAIKDNMCTKGMRTTCSSKILENFVPTYTAEAVLNLEKAGAVILGKTNMDEFAMGSTTETSAYGVTRNPWNTEHVPGGSSGGSCAAVAANECFYALGSDTGGLSVSQVPSAALPALNPPTELYPVTASSLMVLPWTRSDRLQRTFPTVQLFWKRFLPMI